MEATENLRGFGLFSELDEKELTMIAGLATTETCPAGKMLFREGEANGTLYGVLRGSLRVTKRAEFDVEEILCEMHKGDFLGEVGFVNGGTHCASASAVEEAEVFKVSREEFNSLAEKEPRLGYVVTSRLAEQLARFLRSMDERYLNLSCYVWGRGKR